MKTSKILFSLFSIFLFLNFPIFGQSESGKNTNAKVVTNFGMNQNIGFAKELKIKGEYKRYDYTSGVNVLI